MIRDNKKGVEMTLSTIIGVIIAVIVLIVIIFFFIKYYGGNSTFVEDTGSGLLDLVKNSS